MRVPRCSWCGSQHPLLMVPYCAWCVEYEPWAKSAWSLTMDGEYRPQGVTPPADE